MSGAARALQWQEQLVFPDSKGLGNLVNSYHDRDWALQLSPMNEEFPVSTSHKLVLITSLPFVHTARRYYWLNGLVRSSDWLPAGGNANRIIEKKIKLDHLEEVKVVTRFP